MKRVLQFNCSGCAFVCAKKWKCWRPKCFLYPQNREQYKLPWPVLPRCLRPAKSLQSFGSLLTGTPSHRLWAFSHPASQGLAEIPCLAWRTFLGFLSAFPLEVFVHLTDPLHLGRPSWPLQWFWESWLFPRDGSAHLQVASVLLLQGKGLVPPAHCLVSPFGAVHESQSGARGPNVLLPSASASWAAPCPTATRSILNRCCLQHLGLAVRGWEMLT